MSTPAPHVPVDLVLAGGSAFFSARCIKLLTDMGFEMQEFGNYKSTDKYLEQCRRKRAVYDKAVKEGKDPNAAIAAAKPPFKPPTMSQREYQLGEPTNLPKPKGWPKDKKPPKNPLAFQSSHLQMNAIMVESGGRDGGPCSNIVDGHSHDNYPSVPHQGMASHPGGEHNKQSAWEINQASQGGAKPGDSYAGLPPDEAAAKADRDAKERIKAQIQERRGEKDQPVSEQLANGRSAKDTRPPPPASVNDLPKTHGKQPVDKKATGDQVVDGGSAEQCIENFRKMAAEGMRQECIKNVDKNKAAADNRPPPPTPNPHKPPVPQNPTPADREAAKEDVKKSKAVQKQCQKEYDEIRDARKKGYESLGATPLQASRMANEDMKKEGHAATLAAAKEETKRTNDRVKGIDARCAANQGERMAAGQGQGSPRCPGGGSNVPGTQRNRDKASEEGRRPAPLIRPM